MNLIDDFLNGITMYRLVLYVLIFFLLVALIFTLPGWIPFSPVSLILSVALLTLFCWLSNKLLAYLFGAPTNPESTYITAFILSLIVTPIRTFGELPFFVLICVLSISSKYLLAVKKKHLFNPAAAGIFLSFLIFKFGASWWVGNPYMVLPVLIGGILVTKKIKRFSLVLTFFLVGLISLLGQNLFQIVNVLTNSPILFFAFIMLTEPQTTPPDKINQILYGALVGVGLAYVIPEESLLLGNVFSWMFSPKNKLVLKLKQKIEIAPQTWDFVFEKEHGFQYQSGQYMEWTLPHQNPDTRGIRRYFTLSSSPLEDSLRIGIKFYPNSSSFKKKLISLKKGGSIVASQISGDFILPKQVDKKLCFLAGGIGITPFRSMVKYLLDTNQIRDIVLFYSNKSQLEIAYKELFEMAKKIGLKTIYVNTNQDGYLTADLIKQRMPDYQLRTFYLSGPHSMVEAFGKILKKELGISSSQIKVDFFPGYA